MTAILNYKLKKKTRNLSQIFKYLLNKVNIYIYFIINISSVKTFYECKRKNTLKEYTRKSVLYKN